MFVASVSFLVEALLPATAFKARYGILCLATASSFACVGKCPNISKWISFETYVFSSAVTRVVIIKFAYDWGRWVGARLGIVVCR
jgi:hypothetical protein